jgi:hypothetical protein
MSQLVQERGIPYALALAGVKIDLQSAHSRYLHGRHYLAHYITAHRQAVPTRFHTHYRHELDAGREPQRLQSWAGSNTLSVKPDGAFQECDTSATGFDEAQVLGALPSPQH